MYMKSTDSRSLPIVRYSALARCTWSSAFLIGISLLQRSSELNKPGAHYHVLGFCLLLSIEVLRNLRQDQAVHEEVVV